MFLGLTGTARAEDIVADQATLRGVDKITGRVSTMKVNVGEEIEFGKLKVMVVKCWTKPIEDVPENKAYLIIKERKEREAYEPVFNGWMFSSNPALSAMEDPVYDIWVLSCARTAKDETPVDRMVDPVMESQVQVRDLDAHAGVAEEVPVDLNSLYTGSANAGGAASGVQQPARRGMVDLDDPDSVVPANGGLDDIWNVPETAEQPVQGENQDALDNRPGNDGADNQPNVGGFVMESLD